MEDVMASKIRFYLKPKNRLDGQYCSLEAKLLLPLKFLAYRVPPHAFADFFQMPEPYTRASCLQFDAAIKNIYMKEYL